MHRPIIGALRRLLRGPRSRISPRRREPVLGAALLAAGLLAAVPAAAAELTDTKAAAPRHPPVSVRLIGLNDFHGNLEAAASLSLQLADPAAPAGSVSQTVRVPVGGAAALAGLVKTLRDGAPHSLLLASGDLIGAAPLVSTLFRHELTIAVMNAIGLELNATGNHEYDAGLVELRRLAGGGCAVDAPGSTLRSCALGGRFAGARFPLLAANVIDAASGRTAFAASLVKRYGGVRIGIIGAVTRTTPGLVVPSGVAGLRFDDEAASINRAARELRRRGVKAMVLAIHEGGELARGDEVPGALPTPRPDWNDTACPGAHGPVFEIAKRLAPEIRVVFSAHTHQGYRCVTGGRTVIQATSYGRGLSVVDVALDRRSGRMVDARTRSLNLPVFNERTDAALRYRLAAAAPAPFDAVLRASRPDPAIAQQVAGYVAAVAPLAERPVGRIGAGFDRRGGGNGSADSAAGRLVADAQLAATREPSRGGAQLALMNPGGIRSDLDCAATPPCTVSFGQAFTMQPFGNNLVVMTLTGAQLKALLESQQGPAGGRRTLLSPSAGLTYTWRADAAEGERVRDLRLEGEPVQPQQRLRVTVNNFLAEGGDGFVLFKEGSERSAGGQDIDALLDHLKANDPVQPSAVPRITLLP